MDKAACRDYIVVLPAYNEATSIGPSLDALAVAVAQTPHRLKRVIVCLNGCTDTTEEVVRRYAKQLPITIISSSPGYIHAMNRLLGHARRYYPEAVLVKTDADSIIAPNAIRLLLDQFDKHPKLIVAGGHPLPRFASTLTLRQRALAYIFSLRSIYPLAQVAVANVAKYHKAARTDPQPHIGEAELRLKTFFHGRLWCVRTSNSITNLADGVIGDDVYLTVWLYRTYGPGAIRVIYRANTYSAPNHSLRRHWMVYKRIHEDVKRTGNIPEYRAIEQLQRTKLDWYYIFTSVPVRDAILFMVYHMICVIEEISFEHTVYRDKYWQYQEKEA